MADESQVSQALVALVSQIAYPTGTGNPSIITKPVAVRRGWPIPAQFDTDLKAGRINVTVYPTDTERVTTRHPRDWQVVGIATPTLTLTPSNNTLTIGGTVAAGQNACAIVGGTAFVYPVQATDTLTSIATGLASLTGGTSSGSTLTLPTANIAGRVGTLGTSICEIRRQKRTFQIVFWCADPLTRDSVAAQVNDALAAVDYLSLPDGSQGRVLYEKSHTDDTSQKEGLYRRDLFYSVEYATTQTRQDATIVATRVRLNDAFGLVGTNALAVEAGGHLLTEAGDLLLLDPPHAPSLELESGAYMLLEDGSRLLLDPPVLHDESVQLESGDYLLTEQGDHLLLDPYLPSALTLEVGGHLLNEKTTQLLI